jgi:hypothetical protein
VEEFDLEIRIVDGLDLGLKMSHLALRQSGGTLQFQNIVFSNTIIGVCSGKHYENQCQSYIER